MTEKKISPLEATLTATGSAITFAGTAATLIGTLGLLTGSVVCAGLAAGVATVGLAAWFLAKREKMNQALLANHLTPQGKPYSCGGKESHPLINAKTR